MKNIFIPMIPVKLIGGMLDNGNVYIRKLNLKIYGIINNEIKGVELDE